MEKLTKTVKVDEEWILLIKRAKSLGISSEEIRAFLNEERKKA